MGDGCEKHVPATPLSARPPCRPSLYLAATARIVAAAVIVRWPWGVGGARAGLRGCHGCGQTSCRWRRCRLICGVDCGVLAGICAVQYSIVLRYDMDRVGGSMGVMSVPGVRIAGTTSRAEPCCSLAICAWIPGMGLVAKVTDAPQPVDRYKGCRSLLSPASCHHIHISTRLDPGYAATITQNACGWRVTPHAQLVIPAPALHCLTAESRRISKTTSLLVSSQLAGCICSHRPDSYARTARDSANTH